MFIFDEFPYKAEDDGITHINIYSKGKTELGRMLSNFYYSPFSYGEYGEFNSGEGFYYWYVTGQQYDILRKLSGFKAKETGESFSTERLDHHGLDNATLEVMKTMLVHKIAYNEKILLALQSSTLPFCHYYDYFGNQIVSGYDWLSPTYEDIRKVLKSQ